MNHDNAYGGFIVSKNVLAGIPIRYTYREKSDIPQLNGWTILSERDTDEYLADSRNFQIVSASTIVQFAPALIEVFDAPYGTDLFWKYEQGVLVGFYDLIANRDTTIREILHKKE